MSHNNLPKNILVLKNRALGDSIIGLSAIQYIKECFPLASVTYGVPQWVFPLYVNTQNGADNIIPIELKKLSDYINFYRMLKLKKYDLIIELHQSGRFANFFKVFGTFLKAKYFYHNHNLGMNKESFIFEQGVRKSIIQRDLDTIYSTVQKYTEVGTYPNFLHYEPRLNSKKIESSNPNTITITLGVVATRDDKKWPIKHFAKLCQLLLEKKTCHFIIPISKSDEDQSLKNQFKLEIESLNLPNEYFEFVQVGLDELPSKLSRASFYIGNDTGIKHLCIAMGMGSLSFFGPEEPVEWHPYRTNKHKYCWVHGHDLRSKMQPICLLKQFDNSQKLSEIKPLEVADQVLKEI